MLDYSRCRLVPFAHQRVGIEALVERLAFALFDEMGAGKTKQVIDAAQFLFRLGLIKRVIVVAPNSVRGVWYDPQLGELAKHLWNDMAATVTMFHAKVRTWSWNPSNSDARRLDWYITNYEFIRAAARLDELFKVVDGDTLLVLDESSYIKNPSAAQTKACMTLRWGVKENLRRKIRARAGCGRVVILNGTPIANNPLDLFTQSNILDPRILANTPTWIHFRAYYAIMGGFHVGGRPVQIIGWQRLDELQNRLKPFVLRRLKKDCLDLPPKLAPVTLTATLTPETWRVYKQMRDDMVTWLNSSDVVIVQQAFVKYLRLAQLTSGFIGGFESDKPPASDGIYTDNRSSGNREVYIPEEQRPLPESRDEFFEDIDAGDGEHVVREVGREKLDVLLDWLAERLDAKPDFKVIVWCRFRPEVARLLVAVRERFPKMAVGAIHGGQNLAQRQEAIRMMTPETAPEGPALVVGTPSTGSMGLTLVAADHVVYLSQDYRLVTRLQSEDRVHRPGQTRPVSYFDIVAVGPNGQKTVDHTIVKALHDKENVAEWTSRGWVSALLAE